MSRRQHKHELLSGGQSRRRKVARNNVRASDATPGRRRHRVSAIQEIDEGAYTEPRPRISLALVRIFVGVLLLYPCLATSVYLIGQISDRAFLASLTSNTHSLAFLIGAALCALTHLSGLVRTLFTRAYVLGHETTHAIFVFICYGWVSRFVSRSDGGYIIANRSNLLVALSPYIFPFWTLALTLVLLPFVPFVDVTPILPYYCMLCGATWAFNLVWTAIMIPLGQSDLHDNGVFLSLAIIALSNVLILSFIICILSPQQTVVEWAFGLINVHLQLGELLR